MSDEFENLAQVAANVLVSAMAAGSWDAAKRRFAALVGHEHQLESTHAKLAAERGRDLDRAKSEQARDWVTRLQDILDSNPDMAPALRALIANPGSPPEPVIRSQSQHVGNGSGNVNVGGSTGDIATGGSKIDKRKFRISPLIFLGHAAKQAVAHPAVAGVTVLVVGAGVVSGGLALNHHKAAQKAAPSPVASTAPAPTHTAVPIPLADSDISWPQLGGGPTRTGYQPGETRIGPGDVSKLTLKRTYQDTANGYASAPLIANGILYVDTSRLYAFDATGAIGCSDTPTTCTPLWTAATAYFEGMTVADGKVFVTDAEGVQVFDAAGTTNCAPGNCPGTGIAKTCSRAPLWSSAAGPDAAIGHSLTVANGVVYITSVNGGIDAYGAAGSLNCSVSGTVKTCTPLWNSAIGYNTGGSPAIVNGVVFVNANGDVRAFSL